MLLAKASIATPHKTLVGIEGIQKLSKAAANQRVAQEVRFLQAAKCESQSESQGQGKGQGQGQAPRYENIGGEARQSHQEKTSDPTTRRRSCNPTTQCRS